MEAIQTNAEPGQLTLTGLEDLDDIKPDFIMVDVAALPPNEELVGPPPSAPFLNTVRLFGVITPIWIQATTGKPYAYKVFAGRNRIKGARRWNQRQVPALVFPTHLTEIDVLTLVENQRRDNPASDVAVIRDYLNRGATRAQILAASGMSAQTYAARLRLLSLNPDLLRAYSKGELRTATAELAAKCTPEQQAKLLDLLRERADRGERPAILFADVRDVRRAARSEISEAFDANVFNTPAQTGDDWRDQFTALLDQAAAIVPRGKQTAIKAYLRQAAKEVKRA